ncbi:MAG TPA: alcohol dehydrogenase catalytic domain-containing protein [Candidatus Limnocylindrales bacterium]|nr:alcohol dehydrogenase catalytic domain-containing protein [Candidatus Limnocylindrales bacterium]
MITAPHRAEVRDVDAPTAGTGEVVVDVERAGLCGTDTEIFTGEMSYLHTGQAHYPMRIGHEWCGVVTSVGADVEGTWLGRRVTGDTMLGCGKCRRCLSGRQHLCADRFEIGIRGGWPGALAEQLLVPVGALQALPDSVDPTLGALVEPGANATRAVLAAGAAAGVRLLVIGAGTIGLLVAFIARARGSEVHLLGRSEESLAFARRVGFEHVWSNEKLPSLTWDAVVDASNSPDVPAHAVDLVEPGGRVVFIGLAGTPSLVDSRSMALKDVTAIGVLSGSGAIADTVATFAAGEFDARMLVAATIGLDQVADVLAGKRRPEWGAAPKIHVDPRRELMNG